MRVGPSGEEDAQGVELPLGVVDGVHNGFHKVHPARTGPKVPLEVKTRGTNVKPRSLSRSACLLTFRVSFAVRAAKTPPSSDPARTRRALASSELWLSVMETSMPMRRWQRWMWRSTRVWGSS